MPLQFVVPHHRTVLWWDAGTRMKEILVEAPKWWTADWAPRAVDGPAETTWDAITADAQDPAAVDAEVGWRTTGGDVDLDDAAILAPLEAEFGQVRSRQRVRDLAEVFTHQREVTAMLDMMPAAFAQLDTKFLEPAAGSGNFLVEILRRKLTLVSSRTCPTQAEYEHRLLRALASIYGVDISSENVTEARGRLAHTALEHYQNDANTVQPTLGFLTAAATIIGHNMVLGDTLHRADQIELCDWRPSADHGFQRVWSHALIPPADRDLFWAERVQDREPVHYRDLTPVSPRRAAKPSRKATSR